MSINSDAYQRQRISFIFIGDKDDLYIISYDAFYYNGEPLKLVLDNGEEIGFGVDGGGHGRLKANLNLLEHGPVEEDSIVALKIGDYITIPISLSQQ